MTKPTPECPETITIEVSGTPQTVIDILQDQYGNLESGEVRAQLSPLEPEVWNSAEFEALFDTVNVRAPYIDVIRRQDGAHGTVMYIDSPRFYFSFHAGTATNDS